MYLSFYYHYNAFTALKILCVQSSYPSHHQSLAPLNFFYPVILIFPKCHIVRMIDCVDFSYWFLWLSNIQLKFLQAFYSLIAHLFSELTSIPLYSCTSLFVHSSTGGQINCFQALAIINTAAMSMHYVQDFAGTCFQLFQLTPSNDCNGKSKSSFVRNHQTVISVYDILHPNE